MNTQIEPGQFFDLFDAFYSPQFPELGSGPLSTEPYVSAEYFERERERIFSKAWFNIGHASEVPEPGDYIVVAVPVLKTSVIVVRGRDGIVRGFHNACPHRGSELEPIGTAGNKPLFVCPFHSWSFNHTGEVKAIPERDRFIDLDQNSCGLRPVSVENWHGLLFLNAQAEPEVGLKDYLGGIGERLDQYPFERSRRVGTWHVDLAANWKVITDAFQEGYHVVTVHKNVAPSLYKVARSGHSRMFGFELHGNSRTMTALQNPNPTPSPVEQMAFQMAGPSLMQGLEPGEFLWPGLNPQGAPLPTFAFDINIIFPSTYIDVSQGFFWTYEFYPVAVDQTRFVVRLYIAEPQTWSQRIGQEFMAIQLREAIREDFAALEGVQRGLTTGAIKQMVLSDQEIAIRHHYKAVDELVQG